MNPSPTWRLTRAIRFLVFVGVTLSLLSGCATPEEPEPKTVTILEPAEVLKFSFDGQLVTTSKDRSISPDGKYLLAAVLGDRADRMMAIPISGGGDNPTQDPVSLAVSLYEVDTSWTRHNLVQWFPLGWLSDSECVFAIHGWQGTGPHKGKRGTAIYTADIETGNSSLISYVDVPEQGKVIEEAVLAEGGKIYMRIAGQFAEFDLESKSYRLIRDDLPMYYGISVVAMSPKGDQIVCSVYGEEKSGVYIFDVASGDEKPLVETGQSLSFYPNWSPDGSYVLMYTLYRVDDPSVGGPARFNFIYGEDSPFPAAEEITIMDPEGNVVRTISMEGQYVSHAYWLEDGKSLVFLSGPASFGKWGEVLSAEYESVWIADITGESGPVKVADLASIEAETGEHTAYIYPVASLPEGTGALINVAGANTASVWLVSPGAPPSKVADGWWEAPRLTPVYVDSVVGIVGSGGESRLYVVGPGEVSEIGHPTPAGQTIAAYTGELLITSNYFFGEKRTDVVVHRMVSEKVLE